MRAPAPVLVVDAAILVASLVGRGSGVVFAVASERALITSDRTIEETRRRIELGLKRPALLPDLTALAEAIEVVPAGNFSFLLVDAARALKDAVASRNGSINDAHILGLAWNTDADIWSSDRDFAGTGVASWSTPNLLRALRGQRS